MTESANEATAGAVSGGVRALLRLEGLTLLAGMTLLYGLWGGPWWLYAVLFLAAGPELPRLPRGPARGRRRL
jgi:Flp pilus assembly protein TadB